MFLEELFTHGKVNKREFLLGNKDFFIAPMVTIPVVYAIQFFYLRKSMIRYDILDYNTWQKDRLPLKMEPLKLDQLNSDWMTFLIWNVVGAIYCHIQIILMIPGIQGTRESN